MGYEIDFLSVGEKSKSGDAIAVRFGNLFGKRDEQTVIVIDGGFKKSGEELVEHIEKWYQTERIDLVISTHPDQDHSSGLEVVLNSMDVKQLWMHQPWNHTKDIAEMFVDGRITDNSIKETLQRSLENVYLLDSLAKEKKIPIIEPFAGLLDNSNCLKVLGPSKEFYETLLPEFRSTPESKSESLLKKAIEKGTDAIKKIVERWDIETLNDSGETAAENNSSTILLLTLDEKYFLFTGDAGIPALTNALPLLDNTKPNEKNLHFIQIPHHGSQRNVGPTVLNSLIGNILDTDQKLLMAYLSVSKDGEPKHPSKKVTNAFRRRGAYVYRTAGKTICHSNNSPDRGWDPVQELPFYGEVEE